MNKKEFEEWLDIEVELFNKKIDSTPSTTPDPKKTIKN